MLAMSDLEYFVAPRGRKKDHSYNNDDDYNRKNNWRNYCTDFYPLCALKKSKYIEVVARKREREKRKTSRLTLLH